ncbi:MAG: GntR family transcriptional regulator [Victivallaceae bacterium]|nr:GntR family transcriptional regulator [Victivallaceae bacterium]
MLKYQQAKQKVLDKVYKLSPGQPLPPVRSLIKELGFSQITLKRAFDELEAEKVLKREKGAGIFVAESKNNSNLVGVLIPSLVQKSYSQLLIGIQEELSENGRDLLLLPNHSKTLVPLYRSIKNNKLTNLIINPSSFDLSNIEFINLLHRLSDENIRIVIIDIPVPGLRADFIGYENITAFAELTRQIIKDGVRNIIAVGKFESKVYSSRLAGIRQALTGSDIELHQIDITDRLVHNVATEIKNIRTDALLLCDAGSSVDLIYELKGMADYDITKIQIGGVIEQNERLAAEHALTLEKQNIVMGRAAVEMLLRQDKKTKISFMPLKLNNNRR